MNINELDENYDPEKAKTADWNKRHVTYDEGKEWIDKMNKMKNSSMIDLIFCEIEVEVDLNADRFIDETGERLKKLKYDKEI